jgi:hypothetical protein
MHGNAAEGRMCLQTSAELCAPSDCFVSDLATASDPFTDNAADEKACLETPVCSAAKRQRTSVLGWLGQSIAGWLPRWRIGTEDMSMEPVEPLVDIKQVEELVRRAQELGLSEGAGLTWLAKLRENILDVGVVATAKSGKSTFINCLVGEEVAPAAVQPETACLLRIVHDPAFAAEMALYDEKGEVLALGLNDVKERLNRINTQRRTEGPQSGEAPVLELRTCISVYDRLSPALASVRLLDTPGFNEAGVGLKTEVLTALRQLDVIIYLLDVTKLGSQDEAAMMGMLTEHARSLMESPSGKYQQSFFVLNKVDMITRRTNRQQLPEIIEDVAKKLSEMLPRPVSVHEIIPLSAETAFLARQVMAGRCMADESFREDFHRFAMGPLADDRALSARQYNKMAAKMESSSHFSDFEEKVLLQIAREKRLLAIHSLMNKVNHELRKLANVAAVAESAAIASSESAQAHMAAMEKVQADMETRMAQLMSDCTWLCDDAEMTVSNLIDGVSDDIMMTIDVLLFPDGQADAWTQRCSSIAHIWATDFKLDLVAATPHLLERKIEEASMKLRQVVAQKWQDHYSRLIASMHAKHRWVQDALARQAGPILDSVVQAAGGRSESKLFQESVAFEMVDFCTFEREVRETLTQKRHTQLMKGFCNAEHEFPIAYSADVGEFGRQWKSTVREFAEGSREAARMIVCSRFGEEMANAVGQIRERCDVYLKTLVIAQHAKRGSVRDASANVSEAAEHCRKIMALMHDMSECMNVVRERQPQSAPCERSPLS